MVDKMANDSKFCLKIGANDQCVSVPSLTSRSLEM